MKLYKGLPLYKVVIDDDYEDTASSANLGMKVVSLVDDPAVCSDFLLFEKEDEKPKQLKFSIKQEERIITGCAIRANFPIFRNGGISGKPYYVIFQKQDIKKIVQQFSRKNYFNNTSLQHNGEPLQGVYLTEMYIKDWSRGISPIEFESIEDGSLFMSYKIDNDELWEKIKNGNDINGFSIEIESYLDIIDSEADEFNKEEQSEDELEKFVESIFAEEENKKKIEQIEFVSEQKINALKKSDNKVNITIDGNTQVAQIDDVYKMNGSKYLAYYIWDPDGVNGKWQFMPIVDIDNITKTDLPKENINVLKQKPSWQGIREIIDDTVEKRVDRDDFVRLIDEGVYVTINYFNPPSGGYTSARQCKVVAWGATKKGYPCLRIYEDFGTSKSVAEGEEGATIPDYRLLRIDRIINLRPIEFMEHWTDEDLDSRYNWNGDKSMSVVFHHRTR